MANLSNVVMVKEKVNAKKRTELAESDAWLKNFFNRLNNISEVREKTQGLYPEKRYNKIIHALHEETASEIQGMITSNEFVSNIDKISNEDLNNIHRNFSSISQNIFKFSKSPRFNLKSLVDVVDSLGFVIIPFQYLNKKSYASETYEVRQGIVDFMYVVENTYKNMQAYVACPASYYDIQAQINNDTGCDIFASSKVDQAFFALNMVIPTLRALSADNNQNKAMLNNIVNQINNINNNIANLQEKLEREISIRIENERRQAEARVKAELDAMIKAQEENAAMQRWLAEEPLLFAIEKGKKLTDSKVIATMGPCWGPDFQDIVFESMKIEVKQKQRAEMEGIWFPDGKGTKQRTNLERPSSGRNNW